MRIGEMCELYDDRVCVGCGECEICDLDPNKTCDNCGKCLEIKDYASIRIDGVYSSEEEYEKNAKKGR